MKVLLVWCEIPELPKFFAIENPSEEELGVLRTAQGLYMNSDQLNRSQEAALSRINAAVMKSGEGFAKAVQPWVAKWLPFEIEIQALPDAGAFDQVYNAGFML